MGFVGDIMQRLKSSWFGFSFKSRILALISLLVLVSVVGLLGLSAYAYRRDKIAYVYETHHLKTKAIANRARSILFDEDQAIPIDLNVVTQKEWKKWGLPRLPEVGEVFVGERDKKLVLIGRNKQGEFWTKPFSSVPEVWEKGDGVAYWMTSFGKFLGTSQTKFIKEKDIGKRAAVADFLKSGLVQGLVTVKEKEGDVIAGYRELPGTNVNVFVETSVHVALSPLRQFLWLGLAAGSVFVLLGVGMGATLVRGLTRPIEEMLSITRRIARGEYQFSIKHRFNDELKLVFINLSKMAGTLKSREDHLKKLTTGLEHLLAGTKQVAAAQDIFEAAARAARCIVGDIEIAQEANAWFFVPEQTESKSELSDTLSKQYLFTQVMASGEAVGHADLKKSNEGDIQGLVEILTTGVAALNSQGLVVMPCIYNDRCLGFMVLAGYLRDALTNDDANFLNTFSSSLSLSLENISFLAEMQEKAMLDAELDAAKAIQESLLPPKIVYPGVEIISHYTPATHTGGDWFGHYYDAPNNRMYFYIGDVTGHGIASALITGVVCGAIYSGELGNDRMGQLGTITVEERLLHLARSVNTVVHQAGKQQLLMTMIFLAIDLESGDCHFLNAGHNPPFWIQGAKNKSKTVANSGSRLGFSREPSFSLKSFKMEPGDSMFLFTDGLVENTDASGAYLKEKRLKELLTKAVDIADIHTLIYSEAQAIWRGHPPADDVTSLMFRWHGPVARETIVNAIAEQTQKPESNTKIVRPGDVELSFATPIDTVAHKVGETG